MTTRGEQSTLLLWWSLTMEWLNSLVNWLLGWTWTSDVATTKFSGCYYRKCGVGDISTAIMAVKFIFAPFLPSVPFPHCAFPAAISLQPVSINRCTRDARREGAKWHWKPEWSENENIIDEWRRCLATDLVCWHNHGDAVNSIQVSCWWHRCYNLKCYHDNTKEFLYSRQWILCSNIIFWNNQMKIRMWKIF